MDVEVSFLRLSQQRRVTVCLGRICSGFFASRLGSACPKQNDGRARDKTAGTGLASQIFWL